jgi:hypothetical protein
MSEMDDLRREISDLIYALNGFRSNISDATRETRSMGDASREAADEISDEADLRRAENAAEKKRNEDKNNREAAARKAYYASEQALNNLTAAFKSNSEELSKYNSAIGSAGDAALNFGKSLGPLGAVLGYFFKGLTMAGEAFLKQADLSLKATDQLSKLGAAGVFTAEEVRQ